MYLAELKIWNFRKYGGTLVENEPSIIVNFKEGLNLLVGENDCGKTTIIDAIKHLLGTQSYDNNRIEEDDFYVSNQGTRSSSIKIEGKFKELNDEESGRFLEWISFDEVGKSELIVRLGAKMQNHKVHTTVTAGIDGLDTKFEARDLLRAMYLKPLRDAESELTSGYKSRLAQILRNHPLFDKKESEHTLEKYLRIANSQVKGYFEKETLEKEELFEIEEGEKGAKLITQFLDTTLSSFMGVSFEENKYKSFVDITRNDLVSILRKLSLNIHENKIGLGSLNQLFIAMELLLFEIETNFNLALIEEIEAHLHPQAQLRLIEHLQNKGDSSANEQYIITTHSITLASKVKLENVILCRENSAFPLGPNFTQLSSGDYQFIERFLDSTKANLFFAKGVILVEGDAENLFIPVLAELIDRPLHKYGISLVNVGNTAFLRYSKIFRRKNEEETLGFPVSIVTDLDVKPLICNGNNTSSEDYKYITIKDEDIQELEAHFKGLCLKILKDAKFLSIDGLKRAILRSNNIQNFSDYRGFHTALERKIVSNHNINIVKQISRNEKEEKFGTDMIKVHINEWTMEYDIALSSFKTYMHCAIKVSKKIKSDEGCIECLNLEDELIESTKEVERYSVDKNNEEIAYWIYEDLYKKRASKAVAAQYLGELFRQNIDSIKSNLETDSHIKYLVDSIKYVCGEGELDE